MNNQTTSATQQNLKIKEDKESGRGVYIKGATEEYVTSIEEVFSLLKLGAGNRVVSSTSKCAMRVKKIALKSCFRNE